MANTRNEPSIASTYVAKSVETTNVPRNENTAQQHVTDGVDVNITRDISCRRPFPYLYHKFRDTDNPSNITNMVISDNIQPPKLDWPPPGYMPSDLLSIHRAVVNSGTYNFMSARIPLPTKVNVEYLREELNTYYDKEILQFLEFGWPISYMHRSLPNSKPRNHRGAKLYPHHVDQFIATEIGHHATIGPFISNPFEFPITVSPLNTAPKHSPGGRRVIVDLSFPAGHSVNDGIPTGWYIDEPFTLTYPTVDSLCSLIQLKGQGCHIYKSDLCRAYRQIQVDPSDYPFLCYQWRGSLFADTVFPFGLRSASIACQRTTKALSYIHNKHGYNSDVYLDDFCGADTPDRAADAFQHLQRIIHNAGFDEALDKAIAPCTQMTFLGVQFNTISMTMEVTSARLTEIKQLLQVWRHRKKCRVRDIQSLIGKLQFVAKCVPPGRIFISRLLNLLRGYTKPSHYVTLNAEFRKDIHWWETFIEKYNGVSVIPDMLWSEPDGVFSCDANLNGCGAYYQGRYFHRQFPDHIKNLELHINALELITLLVACKLWSSEWSGRKIVVHCDNMATVTVLNAGRTKCRHMLMYVRELFAVAATGQFTIKAVHCEGKTNRIADALSRWSESPKFREQFCELTINTDTEECTASDKLFGCDNEL